MKRSVEQEYCIQSMEFASFRHGLSRDEEDREEGGEEGGEKDGKGDGEEDGG